MAPVTHSSSATQNPNQLPSIRPHDHLKRSEDRAQGRSGAVEGQHARGAHVFIMCMYNVCIYIHINIYVCVCIYVCVFEEIRR